jgi:hypothetical protein
MRLSSWRRGAVAQHPDWIAHIVLVRIADAAPLVSPADDSGAREREVRGRWRHYFDQLNFGPADSPSLARFCALPTFGQSAAIMAIAVATSNKTGPGRTGSTRVLPQARAA